jgi:predicted choloylglycine hydrolase
MIRSRFLPALLGFILLSPVAGRAAEPFRFPEKEQGKGKLTYTRDGLPVLVVQGSPDEIGEQVATLAVKPAETILGYPRDLLKRFGADAAYPLLATAGESMLDQFPADYRKELEAMAKTGVDREKLIVGNTVFDLKKSLACAALQITPERSATGSVIFGRNLDYPPLGYAHEYSLVTVYRPAGKHAFVAVGFPGLVGCLSGMNDAGLTLAILEIYSVKQGVQKFDANGIPYALCYRRVLEECTTIDEAEKLLRSMKRTTTTCLAISDRTGSAVFEITPKELAVRRATEGVCPCTNHFCTKELSPADAETRFRSRERFAALEKVREIEKIGIEDVHKRLHAASHPTNTMQTMIFEPATLRLHLAIGQCPASAGELKTLELGPLFKVVK